MFVYLTITLVIVFFVLFALRRVLLLRSDIRLSAEWYSLCECWWRIEYHCDEVAISLLPKVKISRRTEWGISLKNNENAVVRESEFNIPQCRAGACSCRILYQIQFVPPPHLWGGCHFFAKKMTEGVFIIEITFITPSVSLRSTAPSSRERILLYGLRLSVNVNLILYRRDRACPCPQQISYKIKFTDNRIFSLPCVKGAGLLWRPLHLMQKHRPNRQVRRWVAVGNSEGL